MDTSTKFEKEHGKQYHIGKAIVFTIAAANIIIATISACFSFDFMTLIIQILLSIALFYGSSWVRYLFAIGAALSLVLLFYHFANTLGFSNMFAIVYSAYCIVSSIVLFASKSVSEFLYRQKTNKKYI